ncbi:MAG: MBL fold metallo-hydrolase, partial [Muribaculaceae bacterium]|nr:MBL fold metallo-hydrolase [Muribaculaceae bacterium]
MHQDFKTIGVYDDDIDLFESQYIVPEGISYNSYLVIDEKIALIDTVDQRRAEEWRKNLKEALPSGKAPDYLIVQHLEPDHASQTAWVMQQYPECRMVCTAAARKMLPLVAGPIDFDNRIIEVGDGATLSLVRHDLFFLTAPMV